MAESYNYNESNSFNEYVPGEIPVEDELESTKNKKSKNEFKISNKDL